MILENDKDVSEELVTFRRTGNVLKDLNSAGLRDSFRERPFNRVPKIDSTLTSFHKMLVDLDILELLEPTDLITNNLDDFIKGIETI